FGFNRTEAYNFYRMLSLTSTQIDNLVQTYPTAGIQELQDSTQQALRLLKQLKPKRNNESFEHYILMAEIRSFYLACMLVQETMNQNSYTRQDAASLLTDLKNLRPKYLNKKFEKLNRKYLFPSEIKLEN